MENVRVGIIGAGSVAQGRHIPRLKNVPGVQVTHAWSRTPETAQRAAAQFDIPVVVDDWREIVDSPDVDAVVVATPPLLHLPATIAALDAGKHVLCQARMARNLAEARRMCEAARATDLVTTLYPPLPGLTGDRLVRRLVQQEGYVGEVTEVRVTKLDKPAVALPPWSNDPEVVGVNAMILGILAEVTNRWVGPAASVSASVRSHEGGGPVPDSVSVSAELESGGTMSYHLSSQARFGPGGWIEIYGTHGALVYKLFAEEIMGAGDGDEALGPLEVPADEVRTQTTDAEFIAAIRDGTPVSPDFEEGLRYMEFCEAVAQSAMSGQRIPMPPAPKMDAWGSYLREDAE